MTRAFVILRDDKKTVCKLYKLSDGYPSAIQEILNKMRNKDWVRIETLLQVFLEEENGSVLLPTSTTTSNLEYWDYIYQIDNDYIRVVSNHRKSVNFNGKITDFLLHDFSNEWREGSVCDIEE